MAQVRPVQSPGIWVRLDQLGPDPGDVLGRGLAQEHLGEEELKGGGGVAPGEGAAVPSAPGGQPSDVGRGEEGLAADAVAAGAPLHSTWYGAPPYLLFLCKKNDIWFPDNLWPGTVIVYS